MYDAAAAEYRIILEQNPSDAHALYHLGLILLSKREYQAAVSYFQEVLQINPDNVLTHGALGVAYYKLGPERLAIQEFQEVLRLDPQNQNARTTPALMKKDGISRDAPLRSERKK